MTSRLLILVLGVHRSGTSLLTQGLRAAGVSAGDFEDIEDVDNPTGYGEHPGIRQFNDRLLAHLGASWDNWGFRASQAGLDRPELEPWRAEAGAILRSSFEGPGPFVVKDPRIATLLPFWERAIPAAGFVLRRLLILRDPAEVAESQIQRVVRRPTEFPVIDAPEPMAALWAVTMHEVLSALATDDTLVLRHADLVRDPARVLRRAAEFAGAPNPAGAEAFATERADPQLYRARLEGGVPDGSWMSLARRMFDALAPSAEAGVLTAAEARRIVRAQRTLATQMKGLPAVRDSIQRLLEIAARRKETEMQRNRQIGRLRLAVWTANGTVSAVPGPNAAVAAARLLERFPEGPPVEEVAIIHFGAELLAKGGHRAEAERWVRAGLARHPGHQTLETLLRRLAAPVS